MKQMAWTLLRLLSCIHAIAGLRVRGNITSKTGQNSTAVAGVSTTLNASAPWRVQDFFVISLLDRQDRWKLVRTEFVAQGLTPTRVEAISGKALMSLLNTKPDKWLGEWKEFVNGWKERRIENGKKIKQSNIDPRVVQVDYNTGFNAQFDHRVNPSKNISLSPGEVGCIMSHVNLWRQIAVQDDRVSPNHALSCIFEDDAQLVPNFLATMKQNVLAEVPADADILYLSYIDMDPENDVKFSAHLIQPHVFFSTQSYCLTPHGATRLLNLLPVRGPLDVWLAEHLSSIRAFGAKPKLVTQHPEVVTGDSDIEHTALTDTPFG